MATYRPYSIITPPFEVTSGGIRVMYGLYGWLLAKGQLAFLNAKFTDPNFVAIYPEIYHGNPTGARYVVRYILNKPGAMSLSGQKGPTSFEATDMLYYFSRLFGKAYDEKHYLFLPIINVGLFKDQKKLRNKTAYFVGKGKDTQVHPVDAIKIDRQLAQDQAGLANLLNECQVLYCYDPVTAMTEIARLCGCRVVIIPSIYTKEEFKDYEPGMNGISWGKDEGVPLEVEGFRDHYSLLRLQFSQKLNLFIEDTQKGVLDVRKEIVR